MVYNDTTGSAGLQVPDYLAFACQITELEIGPFYFLHHAEP